MFEGITRFFKNLAKTEKDTTRSKDAAKERLHLVLMQDRANVSADFLDLMKQEIIEVIKKYIDIDESAMDVRLTNKQNDDGTTGAPALYANIPIMTIKDEARKQAKVITNENTETKKQDNVGATTGHQDDQTGNTNKENIEADASGSPDEQAGNTKQDNVMADTQDSTNENSGRIEENEDVEQVEAVKQEIHVDAQTN